MLETQTSSEAAPLLGGAVVVDGLAPLKQIHKLIETLRGVGGP